MVLFLRSIKDVTYEDLIANGGPSQDRLLKCEQRGKFCDQLPTFVNNQKLNVSNMVCNDYSIVFFSCLPV